MEVTTNIWAVVAVYFTYHKTVHL